MRAALVLDSATLEAWGVSRPTRLAFDADGALYVLDSAHRRLIKVGPDGRLLHEVDLSGDDTAARAEPADVAVDARGSVLVLDRASASVLAYDKNGALLGAHPVGPDLVAEARDPRASLLLDAFGRLWLLAPRERDLVRLDSSLRRERAGRFLTPEDSVMVPRAAASLPNGETWIADSRTAGLRRYHASGALVVGGEGSAGSAADSFDVAALAADRAGYVYAGDRAGQQILVFAPSGSRVLARALGGESRRFRPSAVAWSPRDVLAVADAERGEVHVLVVERGAP